MSTNQLDQVSTAVDFPLTSLPPGALARIDAGMPEQARALRVFGRQNSQTTVKLMSLTMLSEGVYRRLRQCVAEIDRRRKALCEASFDLRRKQMALVDKRRASWEPGTYEADLLAIDVAELEYQIAELQSAMEGALKDVGALQDAYEQIRVAAGVPEKWDEADLEQSEARAHVLTAFRLAFSDVLSTGHLSAAAVEYLSQFGVHPYTAQRLIRDYLASLDALAETQKLPAIDHLYQWLDSVTDQFGTAYQSAMARIGLRSLVTEWCQYREILK